MTFDFIADTLFGKADNSDVVKPLGHLCDQKEAKEGKWREGNILTSPDPLPEGVDPREAINDLLNAFKVLSGGNTRQSENYQFSKIWVKLCEFPYYAKRRLF